MRASAKPKTLEQCHELIRILDGELEAAHQVELAALERAENYREEREAARDMADVERKRADAALARVAELEGALEDIRRIARTPPRSVADETVTEITDAALAKKGGG